MKHRISMLFVMVCISVSLHGRMEAPVVEFRDKEIREFLNENYFEEGKYVPRWKKFTGGNRIEYEIGFHDGLCFAITYFPIIGSDEGIKQFNDSNRNKSMVYRTGIIAAFEVYTAVKLAFLETRQAEPAAGGDATR